VLRLIAITLLAFSSLLLAEEGKHLFILSGQSNMQAHRPEEAFTPTVSAHFGKDKVIVVQDALGGQPIQRWYKQWKGPDGSAPEFKADLYDKLMAKVKTEVKDQKLASITFIWMQGERDAKMNWAEVYEQSLVGLIEQIKADMSAKEINYVIGRLSDYGLKNDKIPQWKTLREIQVKVAEASPRGAWVDTDDMNTGKARNGKDYVDDLHMSIEGYKLMGKRFAETSIKLIEANK
jgi:hypothetical protein